MTTPIRPTGPEIPEYNEPIAFTRHEDSPSSGRVEPISLTLTKLALKITSSSEDDLLSIWIAGAREEFEDYCNRQLINATWQYALDTPPDYYQIEIPRPPLVSVDSITYDDADGTEQTLAASEYVVVKSGLFDGSPLSGVIDGHAKCGLVELAGGPGSIWPTTSGLSKSFRIRYTCGYGTTEAEIPSRIRGYLYRMVGHLYRNRHEATEKAIQQIALGSWPGMFNYKSTALHNLRPRRSA